MYITYCSMCGQPIYHSEAVNNQIHICYGFQDRRDYYGPIGEEKTFSEKLDDYKLMFGEIDE